MYSVHHCPGIQTQGDHLHQHLQQPAYLGLDDHWDFNPIIANRDIVAKHNGCSKKSFKYTALDPLDLLIYQVISKFVLHNI